MAQKPQFLNWLVNQPTVIDTGMLTGINPLQVATVIGGSDSNSSLTLESTLGAGTSDFISFKTGSQVEALRISSSNHQLMGFTSPLTSLGINTQFLTVENAGRSGQVGGNHGLFQFSNDASSSYFAFFKTRATVKGSGVTAVQNLDGLGEINFNGADGTNYIDGMYIDALVDGTVSTGIVPTAFAVGTMNASGVLFERLRGPAAGGWAVNGALATSGPIFISAATYTQLFTDSSLIANFAGTVTVTLISPTAQMSPVFNSGRWLLVKTVTNNAVVSASANIAPLAGGALSTAILPATAGKWAVLQSDGINWNIMMAN